MNIIKYHRDMIHDYGRILKRNILNPLVIAIAILALTLLLLGEFRDAWFISVVITVNVTIAIIQEVRARYALRKLEILTAPKARLVNGASHAIVAVEAVRPGNELLIMAGDQLPVDGVITSSQGLECDESLLTGESKTVSKKAKDVVYAGSMATAGQATITVTAVGPATRTGKMTAHLQHYEPESTPLQKRITRTLQVLTYVAIGLSIVVIAVYIVRQFAVTSALKTVAAGTVGIVPEGLLLASTLLLAFGAIKLAQQKVLPQKLSAIEAMALLDVLCVDKTGTLTSDSMQLQEIIPLGTEKDRLESIIRTLAHEAGSNNTTSEAIIAGSKRAPLLKVHDILAFSSERKYSAIKLDDDTVFASGAPEVLQKIAPLSNAQTKQLNELVAQGLRVLMVVGTDKCTGELEKLIAQSHSNYQVAGFVVLRNQLRKHVQETVSFLQSRDVSLRVISGDNPKTVQAVAASAGIAHSEVVVTGTELAQLSAAEWNKRVLATTIFARILPEQKQRLIETFQGHGYFTGMVGDGVNDALALKKANLSIAMFAGAAATRRVADIILLNNAFTSLPVGMRLGNRIMQAIELIATLFFHKVIYGVLLLLPTIIAAVPFPFLPRHVTFMNVFLVTLPSVLWTLFPPETRHKVNPKYFWSNTAIAVIPLAILTVISICFSFAWLLQTTSGSSEYLLRQAQTITVLMTTLHGIVMVMLAPVMLAVPVGKNTARMRLLYLVSALLIVAGVFLLTPVRTFLDLSLPAPALMAAPLAVATAIVILQYGIARTIGNRLRHQL